MPEAPAIPVVRASTQKAERRIVRSFGRTRPMLAWVLQGLDWMKYQDGDVHCFGIPSVISTLVVMRKVVRMQGADP